MKRGCPVQIFRTSSFSGVPRTSPTCPRPGPQHLRPWPVLPASWVFRPKAPTGLVPSAERAKWELWILIKKYIFSKPGRYLFSHCENSEMSESCPPRLDADYCVYSSAAGTAPCVHTCCVTQSCPAPCDPLDCGPPGSSAHGILQARVLEWGATPSCRGPSWPGMAPRLLRLLHWRVLHCQCHLRSQTALRAMYQGQERRRLRRTVLTDVLIISQWQRREIKKKIPLKIEGLHCRVIQATSHSARGRERERHPAGFLRGFTVLWKRQAKDTDLLRTRLFKPICSRRELC